MNKTPLIIFLFLNFILYGCGGGGSGDLTGVETDTDVTIDNDVNTTEGTTYSCAPGAGSKESFIVPNNNPNYEKENGKKLQRFFSPFHDTQNEDEIEKRNSYITSIARVYFFGRSDSFEVEDTNPFTLQSLLGDWYTIEDEFEQVATISFRLGENDNSWRFFSSSELLFDIRNADTVEYATLGDPVLKDDLQSDTINGKKYCSLSNTFDSMNVNSITYQDVIELSCTTTLDFGSVFTGTKLKILLAKDVGAISQLSDTYTTVIENTQETNRTCTQSLIVATKSESVDRANINELENIMP